MRIGYAFLLSIAALSARAQVIQSGGPSTPVNWRPATVTDSLRVDVDGDNAADLVFTTRAIASGAQGQPSFFWFLARIDKNSSAELAIDANEYDSVHRFAAGDVIGPGLLWQRGSSYLAYTVTGNGGTGGRGFFRANEGFVVIRKRVNNQLRYWWFYLGSRAGSSDWVSYYGGTTVALAGRAALGVVPVLAYPNPAAATLHLSRPTRYELFDPRGQLLSASHLPVSEIPLARLPAGLYVLQTLADDGSRSRQQIVKQ